MTVTPDLIAEVKRLTAERDRLAATVARVEALCQNADGYTTWDRDERLGKPPWMPGDALVAWEAAHGHDVRSKCYPEYGCQLLVDPDDLRDALRPPTDRSEP